MARRIFSPLGTGKRETWWGLLPPEQRPAYEHLITRDELLAALKDRGVEMTPAQLACQERRGYLPRAVRSRREGSPVALYPLQAVKWLVYTDQMRRQRLSLTEVASQLRQHLGSSGLPLRPEFI